MITDIVPPYKNNSALVNVMLTFSKEAAIKFYDGLKNGILRTDIPEILELSPNNSLLRFEAKIGAYSDNANSGFNYDIVLANLPSSDSGDRFEARLFQHFILTRRANFKLFNDGDTQSVVGDVGSMPTIYLCWGYGTDATTWSSVHRGLINDIEYDFTPKGDKVLKLHLKDSLSFEFDALAIRKASTQVAVEVDFSKSIHYNLSNLLSTFFSNSFSRSYAVVDLGKEIEEYLDNWEASMKDESYSTLLGDLDENDSGTIETDTERAAAIEALYIRKNEMSSIAINASMDKGQLESERRAMGRDMETQILEKTQQIEIKDKIIMESLEQVRIIQNELDQMLEINASFGETYAEPGLPTFTAASQEIEAARKAAFEKKEHKSGLPPVNIDNQSHQDGIERYQRITQNLLPNSNLYLERGVLESKLNISAKDQQDYQIKQGQKKQPVMGPKPFSYNTKGQLFENPEYAAQLEPNLQSSTGEDSSRDAFNSLPHKVHYNSAGLPLDFFTTPDGVGKGYLKGATIVSMNSDYVEFKGIEAQPVLKEMANLEGESGPANDAYWRYIMMLEEHTKQHPETRDFTKDAFDAVQQQKMVVAQRAAQGKALNEGTRKIVYRLKLHKPRGVSLREYIFGIPGATGKKGSKGLVGDMQTLFTVANPNSNNPQGNAIEFITAEISKDTIVPDSIVNSGLNTLCYFGTIKGYADIMQDKTGEKNTWYHPKSSFRKVHSLACTSENIRLNQEGAVSMTPTSKDLVFTFGRKGVDIHFDKGVLTSIKQDPIITDIKYNLFGSYYLSLFTTPVMGASTANNQPGVVPSTYKVLSKLAGTFSGDRDKITTFLLDWTNQKDNPKAKEYYEKFLSIVMDTEGDINADAFNAPANALYVQTLQKDKFAIAEEISRVVKGDQFSDRLKEGLAIVFGLTIQPRNLKNKRWFSTGGSSFSDEAAIFEQVLTPTSNQQFYIDGDDTGADDENALMRMQAEHYAKISTLLHSLTITIPGMPELSTITEMFGIDPRQILIQIYNHRTGTHHWLSGKYGLVGMEHHISVNKGYTTKLRLVNSFDNLTGGHI